MSVPGEVAAESGGMEPRTGEEGAVAGAAGAALRTTIASFTGVNEVELTAAAGTSVSGAARVTWGTLNNTPFDNAYSALPNTGGIIQLDGGR